jgi:PAS domain S-box-containing protein
MRPDRRAIFLFFVGVVLMTAICIAQISSPLIHGSVYYILLGFYGLWLLRHYKYLFSIGVISTVAMTIGYIFGPEHSDGMLINRVFSILTIWSGVVFTARFRRLHQREQKYKKQLKALFENVSEAILMVDRHGRIILGNPGAERILGYTPAELYNMQVESLIPGRFRPRHEEKRDGYAADPANKEIGIGKSIYALTRDNREVPVEVSLSSYHDNGELFVIAFVTDITRRKEQEAKIAAQYEELEQYNLRLEEQVRFRTSELVMTNQNLVREIEERKLVEEQLRKSQLLYKAVVNNFPDGIIGVLDRDLHYVFVEGKELSRTGVSANATATSVANQIPLTLVTNAELKLRPVFENRDVQFELALGANFYEVIATPFTAFDNYIAEILVVIRNITRQKKSEEDLLRALDKERQLNVLKSRFVTSVSHEFRTPLSTILSSVFLLENYKGDDLEKNRPTHLNRIRRSVNNLTELLDDFLSLGKLEEGKIKVVYSQFSLRDFLDELVGEMDIIKNQDQQIRVVYSGDDVIMLDRNILGNVLSNLLSNAIKYSHPDGLIELRCDIRKEILHVEVCDQGMGIPEKEQKHVFKRFFRASTWYENTHDS